MSVIFGSVPRWIPARLALKPELPQRMLGCRHLQRQLQIHSPLRRWIGSQNIEAIASRPFSACTWLTTTPEKITPDDILSTSPIADSEAELGHTPILLVTPAFAHWVDSSHPFLEQYINRLHRKTEDCTSQPPFHAVVAIVDRLPNNGLREEDTADGQTATESEGISILFANRESILGKAATPRQVRAAEVQEPVLSFSFQKAIENIPSESVDRSIHEIGLRLANTIFVNGKENTLFGTSWVYNPTQKKLCLERYVDFSTCLVTMGFQHIRNSLQLALHPVGKRRKVVSSMGNILRQVAKHANSDSNEPMPASSELEKELPRYIAEHEIIDRRVSVWALIEQTKESPYSESGYSQDGLAKAIQSGGKLHRVMSGGGGWGKKQGLLSLDPETSFGQAGSHGLLTLGQILTPTADNFGQETFSSFEKSFALEDLSTLSQAAGPGDYVQFFASTESKYLPRNQPTSPALLEGSLTCDFGLVSDADTSTSRTGKEKDLVVAPNFFGALSEKALTYLQPLVEVRPSGDVLGSRTKIDVPGSRVGLVLK